MRPVGSVSHLENADHTTKVIATHLVWVFGKIVFPALLNYIKVLTLLGALQFMHFATLRFFFFFSKIRVTCMTFQGFFLVCTCTFTDKWPSPATSSRWLHACILVWMNQHNAQVQRFCVEPNTCCTKVGWIQSPFTCTETISTSVCVCCRGRMWSCSRYFVFKSYWKVFRHQIDCQGQKKAASTNHYHVLILQRNRPHGQHGHNIVRSYARCKWSIFALTNNISILRIAAWPELRDLKLKQLRKKHFLLL